MKRKSYKWTFTGLCLFYVFFVVVAMLGIETNFTPLNASVLFAYALICGGLGYICLWKGDRLYWKEEFNHE